MIICIEMMVATLLMLQLNLVSGKIHTMVCPLHGGTIMTMDGQTYMWLMITWGRIIYFRIWELTQAAQSDLLMLQIRRYRILHGSLWALTIVILIMMVRWI